MIGKLHVVGCREFYRIWKCKIIIESANARTIKVIINSLEWRSKILVNSIYKY